jgi:4-amino-4-deoxy-L-arabinose transferase-like glycosyltransferase
VVLGSSVTFFVSATTARVDMLLALFVTAALVLFHADYVGERRGLPIAFHLSVAAAVLAKGPVGLILPWAVVAVVLVRYRDLEYARRLRLSAAAAALVLPVLWYAAAFAIAGSGFVAKQLVQENFQRLVDAEGGGTGHVKPFYAHLPLLLGGLAPWTLVAPIAVAFASREAWRTRDRSLFVLAAWLVVPLLLFSFAGSKRSVYMLPSYPAVALMVAWWWTRAHGFTTESIARAAQLWAASITWTAALLVVALGILLLVTAGMPLDRAISPLVSGEDQANLSAVVGSLGAQRAVILPGCLVALGLTTALAWSARRQLRTHAIAVAALLLALAIAGGSMTFQRSIARTQTVAPFVRGVAWISDPAADWHFFRGVSYPVAFYARRPVPALESVADLSPERPAVLITTTEELAQLLDESARVGRPAAELGRFTYEDNPERVPLVALTLPPLAAPVGTREPGR